MVINPFIRDTAYFRVARDRDFMVNAEDLDLQFSKLINFMNSKIVSRVNNMVVGNIAGDAEFNNHYLLNIGDGSTKWSQITNNLITDNTITLNKLKNASGWSLLAANSNRIFSEVKIGNANEILASVFNDLPRWQLAREHNIEDRSVTGIKIAYQQIRPEHLDPSIDLSVDARVLPDDSIITQYIQDEAVGDSRIKDSAFTQSKIDPQIIALRAQKLQQYGKIQIYPFSTVLNKHLADSILTGNLFRFNGLGLLQAKHLTIGAIQAINIANNSIGHNSIIQINSNHIRNKTINGQCWNNTPQKLSERHLDQRIIDALRRP